MITMSFRGGCIIRAHFLQRVKDDFDRDLALPNRLLDPYFKDVIGRTQPNWRKIIYEVVLSGIPTQVFSASLACFDSHCSERWPANPLQALRDCFGAHTYERTDQPKGRWCHFDWGGDKKQHEV